MWLRQSTAATVLVGPVLDTSGAPYTDMAIGDFNLTKNGTSAALASAATATHSHNGYYLIALTTGNTDTLGRAAISCNKSGYAMSEFLYMVLPAATYDMLTTNAAGTSGGAPLVGSQIPTANAGASNGLHILGTNSAKPTYSAGLTITTAATSGSALTISTTHAANDSTPFVISSTSGAVGISAPSGIAANVTGNLTGNVTGSVGTIAIGGISSSSFAADAIDAAAIKADAVTKIRSGLMLASSYTAPDNATIGAAATSAASAASGISAVATTLGTPENATIAEDIAAISGGGGSTTGPGADSVTITWTNSTTGQPVADGDVWISTDSDGAHVVAGTLQTDSGGRATFMLDAGNTYYLWAQKDGVNAIKGQSFVAVADS